MIVLLLAVVVGTVLRVVGLTWGLPERLHPDEWVIIDGALGMAERNSFEPEYFMRPDHLEIKLSYLVYAVVARLGFGESIEAAYAMDPGLFLLLSRAVTAVFGIVQIPLAYLIGRRISPPVGAIAAVLFALHPVLVEHSHFATPDIPLTTVLLVVALASMHYLARPSVVSLLVASAAASLSISIKYPGALATVIIALVVVWAAVRDRRWIRVFTHGALAIAAVIVFLFVISPSLFTNASGVVAAFQEESRTTHPGADGLSFGGNLAYYSSGFLMSAGVIVSVLAVIGVYFSVRGRLTQTLPLLIGVVFWIAMSALPLHWARWGIPMYITPLFAAAIGAAGLAVTMRKWRGGGRWARPVAGIIVAVVVLNLGLAAAVATARLTAPDTRLFARAQLSAKGINETNSAWEGYSPFQPGSGRNVFADFDVTDGTLRAIDPAKEYLVLSGCMNGRYRSDPKYTMEQDFYALVDQQAELVAEYDFVRVRGGSQLEPVSIVNSVRTLTELADGGLNGCRLEVYRLPSVG